MKFFLFLAGTGSILGALLLVGGMVAAKGAPQEAAAAALAVAVAVIPYVIARAVQLFGEHERQEARHRELLSAIKAKQSQSDIHEPSEDMPVQKSPPEAPAVAAWGWIVGALIIWILIIGFFSSRSRTVGYHPPPTEAHGNVATTFQGCVNDLHIT